VRHWEGGGRGGTWGEGGRSGMSVALRYYIYEDHRTEPFLFQQFEPKKARRVLCFGGTNAVFVMERIMSWFQIFLNFS
jgi:hypothetical protein